MRGCLPYDVVLEIAGYLSPHAILNMSLAVRKSMTIDGCLLTIEIYSHATSTICSLPRCIEQSLSIQAETARSF